MKKIPPPNFRNWTTKRIKYLLGEYRTSIQAASILKPIYKEWIEAMETELKRRSECH